MTRLPHAHWRLAPTLTILAAQAALLIGVTTGHNDITTHVLRILGLWLAISLAFGAVTAAAGHRAKTLRQRRLDRDLRASRRRFDAEVQRLLDEQAGP